MLKSGLFHLLSGQLCSENFPTNNFPNDYYIRIRITYFMDFCKLAQYFFDTDRQYIQYMLYLDEKLYIYTQHKDLINNSAI